MYLGIHFAARSDVGLVRANNQDSGFVRRLQHGMPRRSLV